MRTAEGIIIDVVKILESVPEAFKAGHRDKRLISINEAVSMINKARKEAIEECAERATVNPEQWQGQQSVNKQSILSLINELK